MSEQTDRIAALGSKRWWNGLRSSVRREILRSFGLSAIPDDLSYDRLLRHVRRAIDGRYDKYVEVCRSTDAFLDDYLKKKG